MIGTLNLANVIDATLVGLRGNFTPMIGFMTNDAGIIGIDWTFGGGVDLAHS